MVRRLSLRFGSVREALPVVREWSRGPPIVLEEVGRPSRMVGLPSLWLEVVVRPSRRFGSV